MHFLSTARKQINSVASKFGKHVKNLKNAICATQDF